MWSCLRPARGRAASPAWQPELRPPVRPIKGQMLALRMDAAAPLLTHVVWAPGAYLVPRRDGRLLVGATVEEKGYDTSLTAGGMLTLLEAAWRAVPAIEELAIDEMWVGHRPGSRDDAPILGPGPIEGLVYATGHHRNGILLTPITADAIARLVLDGVAEPAIRPFGIERFGSCTCGCGMRENAMTQAARSQHPGQRPGRAARRRDAVGVAGGEGGRHRPARDRGRAQRRHRPARGLAADAAAPRRQRRDRPRPSGRLRSYCRCPIP